jgi:hypothetical protein
MDAGDPENGAYFPVFAGDRALPGPSPSANLAGIWKGKERKLKPLPGGFLFSSALKGGKCVSERYFHGRSRNKSLHGI